MSTPPGVCLYFLTQTLIRPPHDEVGRGPQQSVLQEYGSPAAPAALRPVRDPVQRVDVAVLRGVPVHLAAVAVAPDHFGLVVRHIGEKC